MDFRLIRSGMRVKLKNKYHNKMGTIKYVYNAHGFKTFDILFDGEELLNVKWTIQDREQLNFDVEEYKADFDKLISDKKSRKK